MKHWIALIAAVTQLAVAAPANDYPAREIKVVVPLAPGGGTDTITRQLTDRMAKQIGKPIIIENKGGAGTTIGMAAGRARAARTATRSSSTATPSAIFEYIFANLKFDVHKDFVPVAYFASAPIVLAAHPSLRREHRQGVAGAGAQQARARSTMRRPGVGTPHDLAGLLLMQKAGVKFNEIAYKGNGPALSDLLAGHVQIGMFTISNVLRHVQAGKLKVAGGGRRQAHERRAGAAVDGRVRDSPGSTSVHDT